MNITKTSAWTALPLAAALALTTGCEDPADAAPKAAVTDAKTAAAAEAPAKGGWVIQAEGSKLGFVGSKVTGSHEGGFKVFTGTAELADGKPEGGRVTVEIDAASVFTDRDKLTRHLKSDDFFHVEKFPKARFTSTAIEAGGAEGATHTVTGNLELHGVTKSITFPATIAVAADAITVKSEFALNRKDFEINYPGMKDDLIRDEVVLKLDLKLNKAEGAS